MNRDELREIIADVVNNYSFDDELMMCDLAEMCCSRFDWETWTNETDVQDISYEVVDDEMIYYDDQWDLLRAVCEDPREANFDDAIEKLNWVVHDVAERIKDYVVTEHVNSVFEEIDLIKATLGNIHSQIMELQERIKDVQDMPDFEVAIEEINFDFSELEYDVDLLEGELGDIDIKYNEIEYVTAEEIDDDVDNLLLEEETNGDDK